MRQDFRADSIEEGSATRIGQTAHHPVSHPIGSFRVWAADARRALIRATLRLPRRPVFWAVPASPPVWQHLVYRLDRTHPQCAASGSPPDLMPRFFDGTSSGDPPVFGDACPKQIGASAYSPFSRGNTGPALYLRRQISGIRRTCNAVIWGAFYSAWRMRNFLARILKLLRSF